MPFPQAPAGARRIIGGWRRSGWLWRCGRSCWWCSRCMAKRSSLAGSGRGGEGPVREVLCLLSQDLACLVFNSSFTHAFIVVCETPKSLAICQIGRWGVSSMIAWTFSMNSLVRVFLVVSSVLGFRSTTSKGSSDALSCALKHWTVRICILRVLAMVTWIGREYELYSGASPISLVEHCVTFRHDRSLLSLLGFVHNWPTSRWSAAKKKIGFH